jgi:hypothetical protein
VFQQVERNVSQHGKAFGAMALPNATVILAEGYDRGLCLLSCGSSRPPSASPRDHQKQRRIPLLRGGIFWAELTDGGIQVSNLHNEPLLPWTAFEETVRLLVWKGGRAIRGNATEGKLGEEALPLDSVEGHVAQVVYGKRPGDSILRRITPIACILIWAAVRLNKSGLRWGRTLGMKLYSLKELEGMVGQSRFGDSVRVERFTLQNLPIFARIALKKPAEAGGGR